MAKQIWQWFRLGLPFHRVAFWLSFIVSIVLIVAGFICPPLAEISSSILIGVGEMFAFGALSAAIKAIEDGKEVEVKKNDLTVTIGDAGENFHHNNNHIEGDFSNE